MGCSFGRHSYSRMYVLGEGVFILWFSLDLAKAGPVDFCVVKEKSFYNFWSFIKKLYI